MLHVQGIWGSHDDAVRALRIKHIGEDRICRHTGLSGEVGRAEGRVDYGGELAGCTIPDQLDMVAPDQAGAHHRDANPAHNLTRRGFSVSMKRSPLLALLGQLPLPRFFEAAIPWRHSFRRTAGAKHPWRTGRRHPNPAR